MGLKKYKPITPGQRTLIGNSYEEITTSTPEKSLIAPISKSGGRNNDGRMTMRYRGGGHKRRYRVIDFKRNKFGIPATVKSIEYDPNRSAFIALLNYADGEKRYMVAPEGLQVGATLLSGDKATPDVGNALYLKDIPLGTVIHCIELHPGNGAAMARSAGTFAQLAAREGDYAIIKLPSSETRKVSINCLAVIGSVSNPDHSLERMGKAGRNRWKGRRPRTRGVAMNPVDHPMGGGEGKASGGHPRSRNGIFSKGQKTRSPKKASNKFIVSRRKKK